eukprot:4883012-Pleurochrysis_carterae.AAC.1
MQFLGTSGGDTVGADGFEAAETSLEASMAALSVALAAQSEPPDATAPASNAAESGACEEVMNVLPTAQYTQHH